MADNAPAKPNQLIEPSAITRGAAAAREAVAAGAAPSTLAEPAIGGQGGEGGEGEGGEQRGTVEIELPAGTQVATEEGAEEEGGEGEGGEAAAQPGAEGQPEEPFIVALPELRRGQSPIELECENQEVADAINSLIKGNLRRDQFGRANEELQRQREEMLDLQDRLLVDPVGFVTDTITNQDVRTRIALNLLADPVIMARVEAMYTAPEGQEVDREKIALKLANERGALSREAQSELVARREARHESRITGDTIDRIIPEDFDDQTAAEFREDCFRDLKDYVEREGVTRLRQEDLPYILERRCQQYGITLDEAVESASANAPVPIRTRSPGRPAGRAPGGAPARSTGQRFTQGAAARRAAAATPPSGAGAPGTRITLPAGQTIEERAKSLREMFGLKRK